MAESKRTRKRKSPAKTLGDPSKTHPSNLGKQLIDAVNKHNESARHPLSHVARLCLRGLGDHADIEGWCYPGHQLLMSYCDATEKTVSRVLTELIGADLVACIEADERRAKALSWYVEGAPENKPWPTAKLYLLKTIARPKALAWFDNAQRVLGRLPPARPELARWAVVSNGEKAARHHGTDIIGMITRRELDGSALVQASTMLEPIAVRDVREFASAIPAPRRYALDDIAASTFTEDQLADWVLGGGLRTDDSREVWLEDLGDRVKLNALPLVAAAITKRRAIVARREGRDEQAAGGPL